jgi:hypothetical protein
MSRELCAGKSRYQRLASLSSHESTTDQTG